MLSIEELKTKTVFEIKSYAKKNNIDLKNAKTKVEMLNVFQGIYPDPEPEKTVDIPHLTVAIYSKNNKYTNDKKLGSLKSGYNIINKEAADWWLTRKGVRSVTPEELAAHYGVK